MRYALLICTEEAVDAAMSPDESVGRDGRVHGLR